MELVDEKLKLKLDTHSS